MKLSWTRLTNTTHRFEALRDDGTHEVVELETRSLLLHDLVHYAVEAEAGLTEAFFGLLAQGTSLARLNDRAAPFASAELDLAERLVGPLQSVHHGRLPAERFVEHLADPRFDAAFLARVLERLRHLTGRWRGTPFHSALQLPWPPQA